MTQTNKTKETKNLTKELHNSIIVYIHTVTQNRLVCVCPPPPSSATIRTAKQQKRNFVQLEHYKYSMATRQQETTPKILKDPRFRAARKLIQSGRDGAFFAAAASATAAAAATQVQYHSRE